MLHTADLNHVCSCASDICSHTVQEICDVYHMRLLRHILHDGQPLCHRRRHHYINRRAYADYVKINMLADQPVRFRYNLSVFNRYIGS